MKAGLTILFFVCTLVCRAGILTPQDCSNLANEILDLHATHRDDKVFVQEFSVWTIGLFALAADSESKGEPRIKQVKLFIAFYLCSKLLYQYSIDHKDALGDEVVQRSKEIARHATEALAGNQIPLNLATGELDAFRRPFGNNPTFRLRSLGG